MADTTIDVKRTSPPQPTPAPRASSADLFRSFRDEVDRMFDQFWRGFGMPSLRGSFAPEPVWSGSQALGFFAPRVDVSEDERAYHISAELPGVSEKDVDVILSGDMLTISAEKSEEKEERNRNYHFAERRSGSFRRTFSLPQGVDRDHVEATLKKGVLTLTLPKTEEARQRQKKIAVKGE
jgi:HSP20 family protein